MQINESELTFYKNIKNNNAKEFVAVYLLFKDINIHELHIELEELDKVEWVKLSEIIRLFTKHDSREWSIPEYTGELLNNYSVFMEYKKYLDRNLNVENCNLKGYSWVQDIIISELQPENLESLKPSFEKGYLLGVPKDLVKFKNSHDTVYGFYGPKDYVELLLPNYVDDSLTPLNASTKGYTYVKDIHYDREADRETMKEVLDLVEREGYKLGTSSNFNNPDPVYPGLYQPIEND